MATSALSASPLAEKAPRRSYDWTGIIPFVLCHVAVLGALWSGVTWQAVVVGIVLYWARIFGVTAGYHRYFSHRAFSTSRPMASGVRSRTTRPPPARSVSVHGVASEQMTGHAAERLSAMTCPKFSPRVGNTNAS